MAITVDELRSYAGLPGAGVLPDTTLEQYMAIASLVITEDLVSSEYSADRLKQIELNLAAHFATLGYERGGLTMQKIGTSEERYQVMESLSGSGLASTRFGQVVSMLDTLGLLAALSSKPLKARFEVV